MTCSGQIRLKSWIRRSKLVYFNIFCSICSPYKMIHRKEAKVHFLMVLAHKNEYLFRTFFIFMSHKYNIPCSKFEMNLLQWCINIFHCDQFMAICISSLSLSLPLCRGGGDLSTEQRWEKNQMNFQLWLRARAYSVSIHFMEKLFIW